MRLCSSSMGRALFAWGIMGYSLIWAKSKRGWMFLVKSGYSRIIQEVQFGLIVWNSVIPHSVPSYAMWALQLSIFILVLLTMITVFSCSSRMNLKGVPTLWYSYCKWLNYYATLYLRGFFFFFFHFNIVSFLSFQRHH